MSLIILTGASGSGKTSIVKGIESKNNDINCYYFDSVGVPSPDEMKEKYSSGESWQRVTTFYWLKKIIESNSSSPAVLDGQMRISFIMEALAEHPMPDTKIVLIDCLDEVRAQRLINRNQPELVNDEMMNWAKYLRKEALDSNLVEIHDNSYLKLEDSVQHIFELINKLSN